jgi:hypothetical protein
MPSPVEGLINVGCCSTRPQVTNEKRATQNLGHSEYTHPAHAARWRAAGNWDRVVSGGVLGVPTFGTIWKSCY